jgi:hypothetical protein
LSTEEDFEPGLTARNPFLSLLPEMDDEGGRGASESSSGKVPEILSHGHILGAFVDAKNKPSNNPPPSCGFID